MPKIAIAGFQHETNTFAPMPTLYDDFQSGGAWPALTQGDQLLKLFAPLNIPMGGFITAANAAGWQLHPCLWAGAEPAGYVSADAFNRITDRICEQITAAGDLDAIYLDLHGAMVVDGIEDGEGEVLRRIRQRVAGADRLPIAVSLDLHGNMTPEFFALASAVTVYRTYPHIDMADTGARAQKLLATLLQRGTAFASAFRQLDYLIPLPSQSTMRDPARQIYAAIESSVNEGVDSVDLALGFPPADIQHCGASVFVYGSDQAAVDARADAVLLDLHQRESEFLDPLVDVDAAVADAVAIAAEASRPVVIADPQDNPGAGAVGDTTGLLAALVNGRARDAYLGMLWDPAAAARAHEVGPGAQFEASLGARYPQAGNQPLSVEVEVEALANGQFTFTGPMFGGSTAKLGPMALLRVVDQDSDVHVIVSTSRTQNADQEIYRHVGIEPAEHAILAVKSSAHFLADYEPIAEKVIFAEAAGVNPCRLQVVRYANLRSGIRLGPNGPVHS